MEEKLTELIKDREDKLAKMKGIRSRNNDATVQEVTKAWIMDLTWQIKELGQLLALCKATVIKP